MSKYHCDSLGVYANSLQDFFEGILEALRESSSNYDVGSVMATREDMNSIAGISVDFTLHDKGDFREISITADGETRNYRVTNEHPFDQESLFQPYEEERQRWLTEAIRGGYPIDFPLMEVKR